MLISSFYDEEKKEWTNASDVLLFSRLLSFVRSVFFSPLINLSWGTDKNRRRRQKSSTTISVEDEETASILQINFFDEMEDIFHLYSSLTFRPLTSFIFFRRCSFWIIKNLHLVKENVFILLTSLWLLLCFLFLHGFSFLHHWDKKKCSSSELIIILFIFIRLYSSTVVITFGINNGFSSNKNWIDRINEINCVDPTKIIYYRRQFNSKWEWRFSLTSVYRYPLIERANSLDRKRFSQWYEDESIDVRLFIYESSRFDQKSTKVVN